MRSLQEIVYLNNKAVEDANTKRVALIKSELAKCDNAALKEILSTLADKE